MTTRQIRTTTTSAREELADALQALFVAELQAPSKPIWIVTPWISDVPIIDNRTGRFGGLLPDFPQRWIRLTELLVHQLALGGSITIACRPIDHNQSFTNQLERRCAERGFESRLAIRFGEELHEKGILTTHILISGSMNLTFNGLRRLEESIQISDDPDLIGRTRNAYKDRWGAP